MIKVSVIISGTGPYAVTEIATETDKATKGEIASLNEHCKRGFARHSPDLQKVAEALLKELLGQKGA